MTELERLGESIAATAAQIDALTHRLLRQLREFDERGGWAEQGALSCAGWLSWRTGIAPGAARERVRVARRLGELTGLDAAFEAGEVTYSKLRAVTRVATAENQQALLDMARHMTAAQLEKTCRFLEQATAGGRMTPEENAAKRSLSLHHRDDGMVVMQVVMNPEEADVLIRAIEISSETRDRVAGLVSVAERALQAGHDGDGRRPAEVTITVDAATLKGETSSGTGLPPEVVRRLCCDSGLVVASTDGQGEVLDVGRKTRVVSTAMRRALRLRDGHCQFPGCANHRWVDAHHIEHWMDGGETRLSNMTLLCRLHHTFVHDHNFRIDRAPDGSIAFLDPRGRPVASVPPRPTLDQSLAALPPALAKEPAGDGDPVDYDACLEVLLGSHHSTSLPPL